MTRPGSTKAVADHFPDLGKMVLPVAFNSVEFDGIGTCPRYIFSP